MLVISENISKHIYTIQRFEYLLIYPGHDDTILTSQYLTLKRNCHKMCTYLSL